MLSVKYGGKYVLIQPFYRLFSKFPSWLNTLNSFFSKFQNPSFSHRADAKWSLRHRQTRVWRTDGNRDVLQDTRVVLHAKQGASEPGWIIPRNVDRLCHGVSLLAKKSLRLVRNCNDGLRFLWHAIKEISLLVTLKDCVTVTLKCAVLIRD